LRQEQGRRGTVVLEHDGARWSTMEHDGARWSTMFVQFGETTIAQSY
jgi:hypothetical protein